jgi:hypothetical protein
MRVNDKQRRGTETPTHTYSETQTRTREAPDPICEVNCPELAQKEVAFKLIASFKQSWPANLDATNVRQSFAKHKRKRTSTNTATKSDNVNERHTSANHSEKGAAAPLTMAATVVKPILHSASSATCTSMAETQTILRQVQHALPWQNHKQSNNDMVNSHIP